MRLVPFALGLGLLSLAACGAPPSDSASDTTNHLADSQSPYLLQHAHNPVDWYPWGEPALEKAQAENKLLVISVGYAACHWCHVMEEESFEDTAVARLMNDHFVSIKVDREERPDVDDIYMNAAVITSGRTGWPLNAIALPDGKPVFAATYFPKDEWMKVLGTFRDLYQRDPQQLSQMAQQVTQGVSRMDLAELVEEDLDFAPSDLDSAVQTLLRQVDSEYGGLQGAPKFALPLVQELLLTYHRLTGNTRALEAVQLTLDRLWQGGVYDHLGGGFARYSVDSVWHVPHFEKMLYDNAQLVALYSQAYRSTRDSAYRRVVYETLAFVEREMSDSLGGFYSSLDADSEGQEGNYYTWTEKDIFKALGREADVFKAHFNVSPFGNWPERRGDKLNILHITESSEDVRERFGLTAAEFEASLAASKDLLREERQDRERPALDDKVLTGWNALMISGYAEAYRSFGEARFLQRAIQCASFIQAELYRPDGGLFRSWKDGQAHINAFASDYGLLIQAYLDLYQASLDERWLRAAEQLMEHTIASFFDESTGLFYFTGDEDAPLITRHRDLRDNVLPAANSTLARDLFYLGHYLYRPDYLAKARQMLTNVAENLPRGGVPTANWSILLAHHAYPFYEVAVVGEQAAAKRAELDQAFLPNSLLLGGTSEGDLKLLANKRVPGQTLIYVCREKVCQQPTGSPQVAWKQMGLGR